MTRPLYTWLAFGVCLAVVIAAMGWTSLSLARLDERAELEDRVRLALWRMESAVAPLIMEESARPAQTYVRGKGQPLVDAAPTTHFHFQIESDGTVTSPDLPAGGKSDVLPRALAWLHGEQVYSELSRALPNPPEAQPVVRAPGPSNQPPPEPMTLAQQPGQQGIGKQAQARGQQEYQQRVQHFEELNQNAMAQNVLNVQQFGLPAGAHEGGLRPLWRDGKLLLARRAVVGGREYVQGSCLNWPVLSRSLLEKISDLLPDARLLPPCRELSFVNPARMLAALPIVLEPGALPASAAGWSPIRLSLLIAWLCVLLAALAVAWLMQGALALSNRRAAFVSAVTHELRTPLTTFRMYTEMLTAGMVPGEARRQQYLQTLASEADRLNHLVENVLSYARLEQGRAAARVETLALRELIERAMPRLVARAAAAQRELVVEVPEAIAGRMVRADVSAVEQILFNLVDNACKYGQAEDGRIHLSAGITDGRGVPEPRAAKGSSPRRRPQQRGVGPLLCVMDHGPGVDPRVVGRLFSPFCKSSREAADSAPGIGLGLALSRRLARGMGGDLRLERSDASGTTFCLSLPRE